MSTLGIVQEIFSCQDQTKQQHHDEANKKHPIQDIESLMCLYFAAHDAYKCAWGSCELTDAYIFVYKPSFISVKRNNMLTLSA